MSKAAEKMNYTIRLRALRSEDAALTWKWRNLPEVRTMYAGHPFFVNPEKEKKWFENILLSDYPHISFGIELVELEKLIGLCFLRDVNYIHRTAEYSIFMIDKTYENRWYLRHAFMQSMDFAFNQLNLNKVWAKMYDYNRKAIALIQYFGFKKDGVLRQNAYKDGKYVDEFVFSMLRSEYETLARRESYARESGNSPA